MFIHNKGVTCSWVHKHKEGIYLISKYNRNSSSKNNNNSNNCRRKKDLESVTWEMLLKIIIIMNQYYPIIKQTAVFSK